MILFLCFRWMAHHLIEKFDNVVEGLIMVPVVGRCLWWGWSAGAQAGDAKRRWSCQTATQAVCFPSRFFVSVFVFVFVFASPAGQQPCWNVCGGLRTSHKCCNKLAERWDDHGDTDQQCQQQGGRQGACSGWEAGGQACVCPGPVFSAELQAIWSRTTAFPTHLSTNGRIAARTESFSALPAHVVHLGTKVAPLVVNSAGSISLSTSSLSTGPNWTGLIIMMFMLNAAGTARIRSRSSDGVRPARHQRGRLQEDQVRSPGEQDLSKCCLALDLLDFSWFQVVSYWIGFSVNTIITVNCSSQPSMVHWLSSSIFAYWSSVRPSVPLW